MADYHVIWSLLVVHNYYEGGVCDDFRVGVSATTENLLKRRGLIWKTIAPDRWALLASDQDLLHPDDVFEFDLLVRNTLFPYITDCQGLTPGHAVLLSCTGTEPPFMPPFTGYPQQQTRPGILLRILLSAGELSRSGSGLVTKLIFQPPAYYWEYIFIFRNTGTEKTLELHDKEHLLTFDKGIRLEYLGHPAQCFRSVENPPFTKQPKSKIRLSEVLPGGKRELYAQLPSPVPGEFIDASPGVIRRIVYI